MRDDGAMYIGPSESEAAESAAAGRDAAHAQDGSVAEELVEALASGSCDPERFAERVIRHEESDPDVVWDVLALLDQNYRRKRIDRNTFLDLKARLQRHSLGMPAEPVAARREAPPRDVPVVHAVGSDTPRPAPALLEASLHREVRVGDLLCGRYRVVGILRQREWMTAVEAVDEPKAGLPGLRQRVTLLVLDGDISRDPLLLQRVGKLQSLSHPAITRILDAEEDDGALILVTEFFSGVSLRELLERRSDRRVPIQSALAIVRTIAGALAHAHARGVAHGDLNAANVLVTDLGATRLQGFELRAQSHAVQPAADRMAFARLAYELLSGTAEPLAALTPPSLARLRAPAGVTRAQWRALRATLAGHDGSADILTAFGGVAPEEDPVLFQEGSDRPLPRPRGHLREWLAAAVVLAIMVGAGWLYQRELPVPERTSAAQITPLPDAADGAAAGATNALPAGQSAAVTIGVAASGGRAEAARVDPAASTAPAPDDEAGTAAQAVTAPAPPSPRPPQRPVIDLASTYAWVDTSEPVARIWVTRRGSLGREVRFRWWTETGTAQVDRDFRAIEPRVAVIPEGSRGVELLVPLMPDPARREPRTFYVKIDEPNAGVDLGTRTLMQVAIVPPGYPAARDTRAAQNVALPP